MKKPAPMCLIVAASLLAGAVMSQNFTYVGAGKCRVCHRTEKQGRQFPKWEESRHSKSQAVLTSAEVVERSAKVGVKNPAENPGCLRCHAPLAVKAPELKAEGVSCEACHGPGSEYKKLSIMKNGDEAVKNGLVPFATDEAVKAMCLNCHANAHDKPFDFSAAWEIIKHPVPEK